MTDPIVEVIPPRARSFFLELYLDYHNSARLMNTSLPSHVPLMTVFFPLFCHSGSTFSGRLLLRLRLLTT